MPGPNLLPTADILIQLRRDRHDRRICPLGESCPGKGHTYQEIADMYGVTKGAVYQRLRLAGQTNSRPDYSKTTMPWTVKSEHQQAYPAMMLRFLGRRLEGRDATLRSDKRRMLDRWIEAMEREGLVVTYDPRIPPNNASAVGGFAYVPARPDDENFVRRPA